MKKLIFLTLMANLFMSCSSQVGRKVAAESWQKEKPQKKLLVKVTKKSRGCF